MSNITQLITDHLDTWTTAQTAKPSGRGKSSRKTQHHGIKKLRELILELAVRGKLVPQDASDEPVSVLLERIAAEKAELVKEKKIKKSKVLPEITNEEKPFLLPQEWEWVRLQELIQISSGNGLTSAKMNKTGKTPVFGGNGVAGHHDIGNVTKPTLVIGRVGFYCGSIHITPAEAWVTDNAFITTFSETNIYIQFLFWLLKATNLKENENATAQPVISGRKVYPIVVGLPPLAEQHRIVTKVDELMALCDQLEQQQTQHQQTHQTLVTTLLNSLVESATTTTSEGGAAEATGTFFDQFIAQHFDTLFTTEQSIDQLKQTLLQLAVMGKLVPQDPNDEPASQLLEKIVAEKAKLIKEKKIKKQKPLPEIGEDEKLFELPEGWAWCKLDELSLHSKAGWSPRCEPTPREGHKWGVLKVSAVTWGQFKPHENKALPTDLEPRAEHEVKPGDFLISRANTAELVARAVIVPKNAPSKLMMSDKIIRFVFSEHLFGNYVSLYNGSSHARSYYARVAGGTSSSMKNVSREQIRNLVVLLPPTAEQHRIVTKVDQLMTLCDQLKTRLQQSKILQQYLADTIVEQAVG